MAELEFFTVTSAGIGAIGVDYVDLGTAPDEDVVYAFVDFVPREPHGTTHWLSGLTVPRAIQLDTVRGRYSSEDGKLRTIIGHPTDEKQTVTATGTPITLTYSGQTTASFANTATPAQVQTALENLSNINVGDVYVSGAVQNERQTVTCGGGSTGGYFTLTLDGATTYPITRNASASTLQAALQALSTIGSDGASVTGPVGGPWTVEFTGTLAGVNVNTMTSTPRSETQVITITGTPTGGQFQLTYSGQTTADIAYNASAATVQAALVALSNIGVGDVTVTGADGGPWTIAFGALLANQNVNQITPVAERNEIQVITVTGSPTGGSFTLTYSGQTTAPIPRFSTAATIRNALQALPNIASGDVAVSGGGFLGAGPWTVKFQGTLLGNIAAMTAAASLTPSGGVTITTPTEGVAIIGGTATSSTSVEAIFLTPSGSTTIAVIQTGSTGTPWVVNFVGPLAGSNVAQMTATNATVTTTTGGSAVAGVELVANTPVLELGTNDLIYDVVFTVPDLDPLKEDRKINPFGIVAPRTGGTTVDLANASLHVPPKPV